MDERALNDLRELARRDAELSGRAERLHDLDREVAAIRGRAEAIDAFFAGYPAEEARRREGRAGAAAELDRRRAELAEAEGVLAATRAEEAKQRAEQAVARGVDHVAVATASLERAELAAAELEREAAALPDELSELERRAAAIGSELPRVPEPDGPRALVDWASHAHAELFVAAGQVDTQRERVIREANELATMLAGEPTYGSTVEQALERVIAIRARG